MMIKKIALVASLLFTLLLVPQTPKASHDMGVDLTYECISSCVIRVYLRAYRDCWGIVPIPNTITFATLSGGCNAPTAVTNWSPQLTTEVTPLCPTAQTGCTSASALINGVEEYYWFRDYDICSQPGCIFRLSWGDCCRNAPITSGAAGQTIGISTTTLNTSITPCNSSPQFSNVPVPYICQGQPFVFNQGATDPDGDLLVYSLGPCYTSTNQQVTYNPGYSPQAPLGPGWNVSINSATGDVTVIPLPGPLVVGVMCVYVEEWRNGNLLNTIVRDMQITVIPCSNNIPTIDPIANLTGATQTGPYSMTVCAGTPISFDLPVSDVDIGDIHTLEWNQNLPGMTFSMGNQYDSIVGIRPTATVTWTPTATGIFTFLASVQDDACPILGTNQNTIVINVQGGLPGAFIIATPTGCTNVSLSANTGTNNSGPYTYQWFGDGNLGINPNNTNASLTHTYPGPGSYQVNVEITDSYGCIAILTDTVVIPNGPTADAGPDISLCSGNPIALGSTNLPPGQTYTWTPNTGLSSSTVADPTFNYNVTGPNPVTINYVVTATSGFCTAIDYVTVVVYPTPVANIAGPTNICIGQSATLTASGGTSYLWSNSATTPSITVSPTATTTYTVTAIANGCASPPLLFTVNVTTPPTVSIVGVDSVCAGGTTTLTAVGGSSWVWSTGPTSQTITVSNINGPTNVSVVASDNGCPGPPATITINLHAQPAPDFVSTTECFGEVTTFTDRSTITSGGLIGWTWDFDDPSSGSANSSNSQHPDHQFSAPGIYNVSLTVTSSHGCTETVNRQVIVNALPAPEFEAGDVCDGETMAFVDQSTANSGIQSWLWDFGTGATSTLQNPTYSFPGPGTYNVLLTVTDNNGCVNQRERTILVHPNPTSDFYFTQHCFNTEARFFTTASLNDPLGTVIDQHSWNFGDPASGADNVSSALNPNHIWASSPRTYNVTLTVTTSRGCSHSVTYPVVVAPVPLVQVQHDSICRGFAADLEVLNAPAGTVVEWFYTPDGTDPFQVDDWTFTTPPLNLTTYYYVALRDTDGCLSPKMGVVAYVFPEANVEIAVSSNAVEIPNAAVEFNITNIYNGPLTGITWNFGDGTTSNDLNPVHQYAEVGVYDVSLSLLNVYGCASEQTWTDYIEVTKHVSIFIPSAFTPNGDGLNDAFNVVTRLIIDFQIDIYDRWGKLIYSSENMDFAWPGTDAGGAPAPEGAYTYVVHALEWSGGKVKQAGTVTLIR